MSQTKKGTEEMEKRLLTFSKGGAMSESKKRTEKQGITRRTFIRTTGAAGIAAVAGSIGFPAVVRSGPTVLNISGWGGAFNELMKAHVYPDFEKEHNCKIETDNAFPFAPKLLAAPKRKPIYDVLHANSNAQWKTAVAGYTEERLDPNKVPNVKDVFDYTISDKIVGVSAFTSAIGLSYRPDLISTPPVSWKDFWDEKYIGLRAFYVITNSLGSSSWMMAGKVFGKGLKDSETAFKAMEALKPIKLVDFTGSIEKMLLSGEAHIAVLHDSAVYRHLHKKAPLAFTAPKEGVLALEQVYSATKGSQKKELAYAYINHILSPKVQKVVAEKFWYSPASKKVVLAPKFTERLFTTAEQVKQLIQVDWKWYNANEGRFTMRFNKVFRG